MQVARKDKSSHAPFDVEAQAARCSFGASGLFFIWLLSTMLLWWLAFYQAPTAESQQWLKEFQAVCFGSMENGLPNGGGWILLVAAPLLFVSALLVISGPEIKQELLALFSKGSTRTVMLVFIGALAWEAHWVGNRITAAVRTAATDFGPSLAVSDLPEHYPLGTTAAPDFSLINQRGEIVSLASVSGKTVLLTFAFAHCQTVCPALIISGTKALERLPAEQTEMVVITLDPYRDTPGALPQLAKNWKLPSNAQVLSGDPQVVENTIKRYNIPTTRNVKDGDVVHPAMFYLIAPNGVLSYTFTNPSPDWLVQAAERIATQDGA